MVGSSRKKDPILQHKRASTRKHQEKILSTIDFLKQTAAIAEREIRGSG